LCAEQSGFAARNRLVALRDQEIVSEYFPFAFASPAEIVDRYWTEISREGMRLIVKEAHGGDIIRELQQYDHFPLNRPGDRTLTPAEVDRARELVAKLLLKQQPAGGAGTADGPRPSGELQKQIDQLRNLRLEPAQRAWVTALQSVLAGLPAGNETLKAQLTILKDDAREAVNIKWVHIRGQQQGVGAIGKGGTGAGLDEKLGEVRYPGGELELRFFRYPNPEDNDWDRRLIVPGPWAVLRLLHEGTYSGAAPRGQFRVRWGDESEEHPLAKPDPKVRLAEILIEDERNAFRRLRVRIQLERPLPSIAEWPSGLGR
jgi:hypothetical protein